MSLLLLLRTQVISGTGSESLAVSSIDAIGNERERGDGSEAFQISSSSASGAEREQGSGTESFSVSSFSGTSDEDYRGSATESLVVASLAAGGRERIPGSGAANFAVSALSSSGTEAFGGSGSESFAVSSLTASGVEKERANGSESFAVPSLSATGDERTAGSGSAAFSIATLDGSGTAVGAIDSNIATGTVSVVGPAISGTGSSIEASGTYYLFLEHSGQKRKPFVISGEGAARFKGARVAGYGTYANPRIAGFGDSRSQRPPISAFGSLAITGTVKARIARAQFNGLHPARIIGVGAAGDFRSSIQSIGAFYDVEEEILTLLAAEAGS